MKPNKDTEYNEFIEWSENLCNKRHDKLVELRKKKAGNNPFKKWFYLGKKVKLSGRGIEYRRIDGTRDMTLKINTIIGGC